jgi:uncharacterized protein YyaL (SSP411 family)
MEHIGSRNELIVKSKSEFTKEEITFAVTSGIESLASSFDPINGGFGDAPKFPPSLVLEFLLRNEALQRLEGEEPDFRVMKMIEQTCDAMARGGMYDQLGGGFARYSVDATWTVPHFEKMLYDNGQLVSLYANAYKLTGNKLYKEVIEKILHFVEKEWLTIEGSFYSAFDADSLNVDNQLEEGTFYVWTKPELQKVLQEDFDLFCIVFNIFNFLTKCSASRIRRF